MLTLPPVSPAMVWASVNRSPSTSPSSASSASRAMSSTPRTSASNCSQRTSAGTASNAIPASSAALASGSAARSSSTFTATAAACCRPRRPDQRQRGPVARADHHGQVAGREFGVVVGFDDDHVADVRFQPVRSDAQLDQRIAERDQHLSQARHVVIPSYKVDDVNLSRSNKP